MNDQMAASGGARDGSALEPVCTGLRPTAVAGVSCS
jgi:hypothetical protein